MKKLLVLILVLTSNNLFASHWSALVTPDNRTLCNVSSLTCPSSTSPFSLSYSVKQLGDSLFEYDFLFEVISSPHEIKQIAFGDLPGQLLDSNYPDRSNGTLTNWQFTIPPDPFIYSNSSYVGGHNAPFIKRAGPVWLPEIGDTLSWVGTSTANVHEGDLFYSVRATASSNPFETQFVPATLVPIPTSIWLFISGYAMLTGFISIKRPKGI